jgi:hypothetical protein
MTSDADDELLANFLVETEVVASRTKYWPAWAAFLILGYAVTFALITSLNLAFANEQERATWGRVIVDVLFPVGDVAYVIAGLIRAILNIVVDPAIASLVAAIPVFLLALPLGAAQGALAFALAFALRWTIRKLARLHVSRLESQ